MRIKRQSFALALLRFMTLEGGLTSNGFNVFQIQAETRASAEKRQRIVAVLDSGIFRDHQDLQCSVCKGPMVKDGGSFVVNSMYPITLLGSRVS